jgi:cation transport regulator ChaC
MPTSLLFPSWPVNRVFKCRDRVAHEFKSFIDQHRNQSVSPGQGTGMNAVIWRLLRSFIHVRRGRKPPADLSGPVWYFAYGSNMNERLFRKRRHMTPIETRIGVLPGYRLVFTPGGGAKPGISAPANIVKDASSAVHGVLYLLPLRKFARLDNSEGKQYGYLWTDIEDQAGNRLPAVTYQARHSPGAQGKPGKQYMTLIRDAARQRRLPQSYIDFLDSIEVRE